jgi:hypothetical protein
LDLVVVGNAHPSGTSGGGSDVGNLELVWRTKTELLDRDIVEIDITNRQANIESYAKSVDACALWHKDATNLAIGIVGDLTRSEGLSIGEVDELDSGLRTLGTIGRRCESPSRDAIEYALLEIELARERNIVVTTLEGEIFGAIESVLVVGHVDFGRHVECFVVETIGLSPTIVEPYVVGKRLEAFEIRLLLGDTDWGAIGGE